MKYYISVNNKPVEVAETKYREWKVSDLYNYCFEDYMILLDGHFNTIRISYNGIFDDFEEPRPFLLQLTHESLATNESKATSEYFKTYEEALARKKEIIKKIKDALVYA